MCRPSKVYNHAFAFVSHVIVYFTLEGEHAPCWALHARKKGKSGQGRVRGGKRVFDVAQFKI